MRCSIKLRICQFNPTRAIPRVVEQTVWYYANGGTWSQDSDTLTLTMGGSGTSGVLRFLLDDGEFVTVAVGVYNYLCWCDIITGLHPSETALAINGQYYNDGGREWMREKQLDEYRVTSPSGTRVKVKYTIAESNNLEADIIFG